MVMLVTTTHYYMYVYMSPVLSLATCRFSTAPCMRFEDQLRVTEVRDVVHDPKRGKSETRRERTWGSQRLSSASHSSRRTWLGRFYWWFLLLIAWPGLDEESHPHCPLHTVSWQNLQESFCTIVIILYKCMGPVYTTRYIQKNTTHMSCQNKWRPI